MTGLRRLDSFEKHKDSFTSLFSKCVGKMNDTPNIKNPQVLEVLAQQITEKFGSEVSADLEKIWQEFDADKNGELDRQENVKLTKHFIKNMRSWFSRMMEEVLNAAVNPDLSKEDLKAGKFAKNVFTGSSEELKPVIEELFSKLEEDVKPMADETFTMMDLNKDGKVVKSEFLNTFVSCAAEIIRQLTLRAMYTLLSSGKVEFSRFVEDLDEEPGEESGLIKTQFNECIREVAAAQVSSTSPLNLHEYWAAVCMALRKKVGCEGEDAATSTTTTTTILPPTTILGGYPLGSGYSMLGAPSVMSGGYSYGAFPYGYPASSAFPATSFPAPSYSYPYPPAPSTSYPSPYPASYAGYSAAPPLGAYGGPLSYSYAPYAAPPGMPTTLAPMTSSCYLPGVRMNLPSSAGYGAPQGFYAPMVNPASIPRVRL